MPRVNTVLHKTEPNGCILLHILLFDCTLYSWSQTIRAERPFLNMNVFAFLFLASNKKIIVFCRWVLCLFTE